LTGTPGLPPLLIQAGDAEVLRDEISLLAHKATLAGVEVRHELYEDAIHIFQTYPFLDSSRRAFMSMREFVRTILPQIQTKSPKMLGPQAEEVLEHEIDNASATVVRGDGVETEIVKEELAEEERTESEPEEDTAATQKTYPSWGRSRSLLLVSPPTSDDDSDDSDEAQPPSPVEASPPTSTLRRIQSAVSVIIPESITRPTLKRHRSQHYHLHSSQIHIPALSSFTTMSPPPSPSIRRSSNASHPDISRLVENWTHSGPANETLIFKQPQSSYFRAPP
jgi:hypothetical protein